MATEKIVLGSGKLYIKEFAGGEIPSAATLEVEANLLGLIQGGCSLEYTPTFYECKDDLGLVSKKFITNEEVSLKSGVMTWSGETLKKLCSTARVTEDSTEGTRTVKIGGASNYDGKSYIIRFVHKDAVDGDIRLTIVGSNESGLSLAFAKDKETVINAEFKAKSLDGEGTLVVYEETI